MADHAWFVSDIHISDMQDAKAGTFLAFLSSLGNSRQCTHLFLVGDIFDLWVGDHQYFQEKFEPLIDQFKRLVSEGIQVHYFEGNHDLHLKKYFEGELGVYVHEGPKYFHLAERTVRVEHGDQADPEDRGYLFLRWFLRTAFMRFLSYRLPGSIVNKIGERASAKSRDYTSHSKTIDEDTARHKLHLHAERAFEERSYELLVFGHVHIRDVYDGSDYRAINLGTWLNSPVALKVSKGQADWVEL